VLGESDEFRKLHRAIEKAQGDRDQAIRNVCRLYGVKAIDALPSAVRAATLALLKRIGGPVVADHHLRHRALDRQALQFANHAYAPQRCIHDRGG
jgi:hypothetical protein